MTARVALVEVRKPAEDGRLIRCRACIQVIARSGERGDVYPVVVGAYVDSDGRLCVTCPSCGERNRLPTRRVA